MAQSNRIRIGGDVSGQVVAGDGNVVHAGTAPQADRPQETDERAAARTVVVADVQGSGGRNNAQQRHMRAALSAMFRAGVAALGQRWDDLDPADLGDGVRLVLPDSPATVLDTFVPAVARELREHTESVNPENRIRLRIAVHHGFLDRIGGRWSGQPLVHATRLVDAPAAKELLRLTRSASLAVIVSDHVYQSVVRHGYTGAGPDEFARIRVSVKETAVDGWVQIR